MSDTEFTGRMQHFMNVMEATATLSTQADFQSPAWQIARDYDAKVMSDIEHGRKGWDGVASSVDAGNWELATSVRPRTAVAQSGAHGGKQNQPGAPKKEGICPR